MLFPLRCPWTGQDDGAKCFFAEDVLPDNADGFDLKWFVAVEECFEFVGGDGQGFGVLNGFEVAIEEENVGVEVAVFVIIGGLTDILVDDAEFCVSEETLDREDDDEDCAANA